MPPIAMNLIQDRDIRRSMEASWTTKPESRQAMHVV